MRAARCSSAIFMASSPGTRLTSSQLSKPSPTARCCDDGVCELLADHVDLGDVVLACAIEVEPAGVRTARLSSLGGLTAKLALFLCIGHTYPSTER